MCLCDGASKEFEIGVKSHHGLVCCDLLPMSE